MTKAKQKNPADRRRFQFSIRALLILTAVVAVLLKIGVTLHRRQLAASRPSRFFQAIDRDDLKEVDRLLTIEPQLAHGRQHRGASFSYTPLQAALGFSRNPKVFDRILQEKPDLDETSDDGRTALHLMVYHGRLSQLNELKRLLELGADPNIVDNEGATPLHIAARRGCDGQLTKLLLDGGADPNKVEPERPQLDGKSPLHIAAESDNQRAAEYLLKGDAQVDRRDARGQTPLHLALSRNHREIADLLLEHGADLTAKDHQGRIPGERSDGSNSEIAAIIWWERIVQLADRKEIAELDETLDAVPQVLSFRTEYSPATLLHRAIRNERLDLVDYLLGRGIDPNVRGMKGQTPLHCATSADCAKHLLDAGADIESRDEFGKTPLHRAAQRLDHEVVQLLIAEGADVEALDSAGTTVMDNLFERQFHISRGRRTLGMLRQAGHAPTVLYATVTADVDLLQELTRDDPQLLDRAYTRNGVHPLHAAVLSRQRSVVEWLLDRGVELDPQSPADQKGMPIETPLLVALSYNTVDIAMLLIDRGADVNRQGRHGCYPAHAVVDWDRDPKILEALLARGAEPTLTYLDKTAVELATESRSKNRERYLELLGVSTEDQ